MFPLYKERDPIEQGLEYEKHVMQMTAEGLHSKSAIAMELAHRDIEINRLRTKVDVFAMHMAEVKAIADGSTKNTLESVVEHCLEELGQASA